MSTFFLDYINIDYNTLTEKLKTEILKSSIFKDIDYEGSNITLLTELFSYISTLNVYYNNKIAQESFIDSSQIYENVYRHAINRGYNPKGYIGSTGTLTLQITGLDVGKIYMIEDWKEFSTDDSTVDSNGDPIIFSSISTLTFEASSTNIDLDIPIKQGKIIKYTNNLSDEYRKDSAFSGSDIVNNKLFLPFINFGYDNNLLDDYESIKVFINNEEWIRLNDFYDKISGLTNESNVYKFNYNKDGQYILEFSASRNVPTSNDIIEIWLLQSIGEEGNIKANSIKNIGESNLIWNISDSEWVNNENIYNIYNQSTITGGKNPEQIEDIKESSKEMIYKQFRNVTAFDYINSLEENSDVYVANVWGEKEQNPNGGNFYDYNKVYISLIPTKNFANWEGKLNFITYETDKEDVFYKPIDNYESNYKNKISTYLEPRKMLGAYEQYIIPDIIYFSLNFTIYIKNNYKYNEVLEDFKNKLNFYFENRLNNFGNKIDYSDIIYELENPNFTSQENSFVKTQGIKKVILRSIKYFDFETLSWLDINNYNSEIYPQWETEQNTENWDYNILRNVLIKNNQFPVISIKHSNFEQGI